MRIVYLTSCIKLNWREDLPIAIPKSKCMISLFHLYQHHCLTFALQNFHGWSKCLIECVALCHVCSIIWRSIKGFNEILTIWPAWPTHPLLQLIEQCALHCPNESESIQERFPTSSSQVTFQLNTCTATHDSIRFLASLVLT